MHTDEFIDHYEALQISPNAHQETVQRVYRLLAQNYHPDNKETGDPELFKQVLEAYNILSDPAKRAAYDLEHRLAHGQNRQIFDHDSGVQGIGAEKRKRVGILTLLCTKRINEPNNPTLSLFDLEQLLACPREHLELSLWYLRESGRIQRTDNGRYALTAKGFELLEESSTESESSPLRVRMLPAPASQSA